jgi:hypothetical protein
MSKRAVRISRWARKRADHPRFYITDGRTPLGVIFETRGVFSAVDHDGRLIVGSTSLKIAVDSLCPSRGSS